MADRAGSEPSGPGQRIWLLIRRRWRKVLRSFHRDVGYLVVGLTFVYALSGLAVNHIGQGDWDPNFKTMVEKTQLTKELPPDEEAASVQVLAEMGIEQEPRDAYWDSDTSYEIAFDDKTIIVDANTLVAKKIYDEPRFFLRVANWLHLNRGKEAWTYFADGYAILLLFLATSGMFMLKGKKGLIGRGAVLIALGSAVPLLYVHFSGGP